METVDFNLHITDRQLALMARSRKICRVIYFGPPCLRCLFCNLPAVFGSQGLRARLPTFALPIKKISIILSHANLLMLA